MYFGLGVLLGKEVLKPHVKIPAHEQGISLLQFGPDTNPFFNGCFWKTSQGTYQCGN